jgi:ParB/RepB/Spo0J family partition protein
MPTVEKYGAVPISLIDVHERYRVNKGDIEALALNIASRGLFHPIIVAKAGDRWRLIAGERRLLAFKWLKKTEIPVKLFEALDAHEAEAVEIEENSRRLDFHWTEQAVALLKYHEHRKRTMGDEWGIEQTADALSLGKTSTSNSITVAREILKNPEKFAAFDSVNAAYNSLSRELTRATDAEMTAFMEAEDPEEFLKTDDEPLVGVTASVPTERKYGSPTLDVFNESFGEYLATDWPIRSQLFNVVHCDFPYGVNLHKSDQANIDRRGDESYEDTPEIYWGLIEQFCKFAPKILMPKAHVLFWYPTAEYTKTIEAFESCGFSVNPVPLIWMKSDNTGILPDPQRGPRRIYESALLMSWGDRLISKAVSNAIAFPADRAKAKHPSEKPLAVVSHFLSMLVDSYTHLLDPTCGSGTSLVAAEALLAASVTGVEMNKIHASTARNELTKRRVTA